MLIVDFIYSYKNVNAKLWISIVIAFAFDLQKSNCTVNKTLYIYTEIKCVGIASQWIQWKLFNNSYQSCNNFCINWGKTVNLNSLAWDSNTPLLSCCFKPFWIHCIDIFRICISYITFSLWEHWRHWCVYITLQMNAINQQNDMLLYYFWCRVLHYIHLD